MRSGRRSGAAVTVVLVLALTACGSASGSGRSGATDANATAAPGAQLLASGPGTPIADGFVVAPGSELVGVAFPHENNGWVAVLAVDDNPLRVVDSYLAQAATHGLRTNVQCTADYPNGPSYTQEQLDNTNRPRAGAQAVSCTAGAANAEGGPAWSLFVHWGTLYDRTVSFTSAYMEYYPARTGPPVPPRHAPRFMPVMRSWKRPVIASTGERFDGDFAGLHIGRRPGLYVAAGSQLAAPVADNGCVTGGLAAVLKTTGGPDVVRAYTKQFADNDFPPGPETTIPGGGGATVMTGTEAGGGELSLTQVTKNGTHWLLILRCND